MSPTCENCGDDIEAGKLCVACDELACEYCGDVCGPANNIPTGAGYANACDYCAKKLRSAQAREDARESAGDDAYDRMKDDAMERGR